MADLQRHVHARSDVGRLRDNNEDAFVVVPLADGDLFLAVCDGMGGHEGGEIASAAAVAALEAFVTAAEDRSDPVKLLEAALLHANVEVGKAGQAAGLPDMGTTGVVAYLRGDQLWYGWVGDSRLYVLSGGRVPERTRDHTKAQLLVAQGFITEEQARSLPDAHILLQALGGAPISPSVTPTPYVLRAGDAILLCSDGVHDLIPQDELWGWIAGRVYRECADRLVDVANARGGHDNATVIFALFGDPVAPVPEGVVALALADRFGMAPAVPDYAAIRRAIWTAFGVGAAFGLGVGALVGLALWGR